MAFTLNLANNMTSSASTSPITHAHTTTADTTLLIVAVVGIDNNTALGSTPSYNGTAMTPIGATIGGSGYETATGLWYLLNPDIGAYSITYPNVSANNIRIYATSWKPQAGYVAELEDTDYIETVAQVVDIPAMTAAGAWCGMAVLGHGDRDSSSTYSHTGMNWYDEGACNDAAQYGSSASGGSVAFSFTATRSDDANAIGAIFKEAVPASAAFIPKVIIVV
jgi:hypothetical protein